MAFILHILSITMVHLHTFHQRAQNTARCVTRSYPQSVLGASPQGHKLATTIVSLAPYHAIIGFHLMIHKMSLNKKQNCCRRLNAIQSCFHPFKILTTIDIFVRDIRNDLYSKLKVHSYQLLHSLVWISM